jgi:hypothetical protein
VAKRRYLPIALATRAVAWSVALIAVAYLVPVYGTDSSSCDAAGNCTTSTGTATLVAVNGTHVLVVIGLLVACTVSTWIGLHFRCARGSRAGTIAGWTGASLMAGVTMISFGLGAFTLPMAGMMIAAAALTPTPEPGRAVSGTSNGA